MLRRQARLQPDKVFAQFEDGTCWTYPQTLDEARRVAASLQRLGVGLGDPVLCWLPNGPELLRTWFGINLRGAVYVPVNTAYRGRRFDAGFATSILDTHRHQLNGAPTRSDPLELVARGRMPPRRPRSWRAPSSPSVQSLAKQCRQTGQEPSIGVPVSDGGFHRRLIGCSGARLAESLITALGHMVASECTDAGAHSRALRAIKGGDAHGATRIWRSHQAS